jgi:hypothetical protein
MSVARTADRIDYWIRRCVHATDFSPADLCSAPHATRRSRANGARQSKLIPAPDRSVWQSIGHYLRVQYDAVAAPVPRISLRSSSNSKRRNIDPQRCGPTHLCVCR